MYKVIFLLIMSSCFKTPDFSLEHTQIRLEELNKKAITNEDLDSKDLNLLFKTLRSSQLLTHVNHDLITKVIIFSKEKNLFRAYIEAFLKTPKSVSLKIGLQKLYNNNPNLLKAYLEYFKKEEQKIIKDALL